MSSSSAADLSVSLNLISAQLSRYFSIGTFLFGVSGNIANILVLSQRPLRSNPCAWLFLVSSVSFLINILASVISRFLSTMNADLSQTNQVLCKIRAFLVFGTTTVAYWLLTLATVDRWLSSSTDVNRRQRSSLKNAQRGVILIIVLSAIMEIQQLYCFEANLINTPLKCYTKTVTCGMVSDVFFALISILMPLVLMLIFGLMIISNVHRTQARLHPTVMAVNSSVGQNTTTVSNNRPNESRKINRQLLIMLFVQVLLMLLLTLPLAVSKLYTTITRNTPKPPLQSTIENFTFNLFTFLLYIAAGMPFYIYTLSGGSVFRNALFSLLKALGRKMMCRRE